MTVEPRPVPCPPLEGAPPPDVLSDVLRSIRLTGAVFFSVEAVASWAFDGPASAAVETFLRSGVDRVVPFHAVASGSCWVGVQGEPPVQLHTGDVILLPQNDRHVVSSEPGLVGPPVEVRLDPASKTPLPLPKAANSAIRRSMRRNGPIARCAR